MVAPKEPLSESQKNKIKKRVLAGATAIFAAGGAYFWYLSNDTKVAVIPPPKIEASGEDIFGGGSKEVDRKEVLQGDIVIVPQQIQMGEITVGQGSFNGTITITSKDVITQIKNINMPFQQDMGIKFNSASCLNTILQPNESCPIGFIYDPIRPNTVETQLSVTSELTLSDGSKRSLTSNVSISGNSKLPPPPPPQVIIQQAPQTEQQNTADMLNDEQLDFLAKRQRRGLLESQIDPAGYTYMVDQKPKQDTWASIGYGANYSTMPVDMTRVVTMDKPIPAVIKLPIDTRNPSRAVATVERDIYGGDGRLVVIERGTTLIGSVGSIGGSGEEKVGISWERLVRPDGSAWAFQATSGDAMGRSGVLGFIDNRWTERFGYSVMASALVAGVDILSDAKTETTSSNNSTTVSQSKGSVAAETFRTNIGGLIKDFSKEMQALPVIRTVPVGTRITVFATTDLWLRPITPNDEMRQENVASSMQGQDYLEAMRRKATAQSAMDEDLADMQRQQQQQIQMQNNGMQPSGVPRPAPVGQIQPSTQIGQGTLNYRNSGQANESYTPPQYSNEPLIPRNNNQAGWISMETAHQQKVNQLNANPPASAPQRSPLVQNNTINPSFNPNILLPTGRIN